MTIETEEFSRFYLDFREGVEQINAYSSDIFLNKLFFSQLISLMEKYLSDVFIYEISHDETLLKKLANENKFKAQSLPVAFALNHSVSDWIVAAMKSMVWHRLSEVRIFYKNVLGISFDIERPVLDAIKKRHDLVHRCGFDLAGLSVSVSEQELDDLRVTVDNFVRKIDLAYQKLTSEI